MLPNHLIKILAQLEKTRKGIEKDLDNYQFGQALHKFYEFFWHNYCDVCLERQRIIRVRKLVTSSSMYWLSHLN